MALMSVDRRKARASERRTRLALPVSVVLVALLLPAAFQYAGPQTSRAGAVVPIAGLPGRVLSATSPAIASQSAASTTLQVERSIFVNYNLTDVGNFPSAVWNWRVGTPAVDPFTGDLWIPTVPVSQNGVAQPSSGPTIIYDPSTNESSTIQTISNASAIAFDPTDALVFATDPLTNSVIGLNLSTGLMLPESMPVGLDPSAIAFDSGNDTLFVANAGSNNVTVIDASSQTVIESGIPAGTRPTALALVTSADRLYVADAGSPQLSVINVTSYTPQSAIPLGAPATTLSYASATDRLAVGMASTERLDILYGESGGTASVANVGLNVSSVSPDENGSTFVVARNSSASLEFVNSTNVPAAISIVSTAVSLETLTPVASANSVLAWSNESRSILTFNLTLNSSTQISPSLGARVGGLAYDPNSNVVISTDGTSDAVDFTNASTLRASRSPLRVPGTPDSVVDDPATGVEYVGFVGGVEAIDPSTGDVVAQNTSLPGNNSDLLIDSATGILWDLNQVAGVLSLDLSSLSGVLLTGIDVGQVNLRGLALDNSTGNLYVVDLENSSIAVINGTTGVPDGPWITSIPQVVSVAYDSADGLVYAVGATLYALDPSSGMILGGPLSLGSQATAWTITYDSSRQVLYVAVTGVAPASNGSILAIQGSSLASSLSSYTSIPVGQSPSLAVPVEFSSATAPDSDEVWVGNAASGTISVLASPPVLTYLSATPNPVDENAPTHILLGYEGGAGPSTVTFSGLPLSCVTADSLALNCTPTTRGTYNITAEVEDSLGYSASGTIVLSVSSGVRVHLSLSATQLDLGIPLNGTASVPAGSGTAPFSFTWTWGDGKSSKGAAQSHTYAAVGTYILTVTATDAGGGVASTAETVTIVAAPQVGLSSSSPTNETDVDIPIQLNATVTGGTTPGTGTWNLTGGVVLHGLSVSHKFKTVGIYFANFTYVDASGYTVTKTMSVQVNPALSIKLSALPSTAPMVVGSSILFNVTISGGTAPYLVFWSFDDGSYASGISAEHSFASPGTYNVSLSVEDAAGAWQNSSDRVTVDANSTGHSLLGGSVIAGVFVGAVVGLALGTLILFLVGRRRRKTPPGAPQPYTTGGSTPSTTEGPSAPPESGAPTEWRED